jgi:hypothetical protein
VSDNNIVSFPGKLAGDGRGPHDPTMEARVAKLEQDMSEVKATLGRMEPLLIRMDERMNHLATRAELFASVGDLKTALESKPGRAAMWTMSIALFGLTVAALAGGVAIIPFLARSLHLPS